MNTSTSDRNRGIRTTGLLSVGIVLAACAVEAPEAAAPMLTVPIVHSELEPLPSTTSSVTSPSTTEIPTTSPSTTATPVELACTPAPADTTFVWMLPPWEPGTGRDLRIVETNESSEFSPLSSSSIVRVEMVAESDEAFSFAWTRGKSVKLENGQLRRVSDTGIAGRLLSSFDLEYDLDQYHFWAGVTNVEDLRAATAEATKLQAYGSDEGPEATLAYLDSLDDQEFGDLLSDDPYIYHYLDDAFLDVGDLLTYDDVLPNPFGGDFLDATGSLELIELVGANGCVVVKQITTADDEALIDAGNDLRANWDGFAGAPDPNGPLALQTTITFQYDFDTGFIQSLKFVSDTEWMGMFERTVMTITDVTP